MDTQDKSSHKDFALGNLADDLVDLTLELCGKAEDKNPRFPRLFYGNYVDRIINKACDIQEHIFEANDYKIGNTRRQLQLKASSECVTLNHLIRIAWQKKWISEKQRDRWQRLTTAIKFSIVRWIESDNIRG